MCAAQKNGNGKPPLAAPAPSAFHDVPARRAWHSTHPTNYGLGAGAFMVMLLYGGLVGESNLLLMIIGMFLGLVAAGGMMSSAAIGSLSVARRFPRSVVCGTEMTLAYRIRNKSRWLTARGIWVGEAPADKTPSLAHAFVEYIPPGQTVEVVLRVVAAQRGRRALGPLAVYSRFPFGLVQSRAVLQAPDVLNVLPALLPLRADLVGLSDARQSVGLRRPRRGFGLDDFFGLRDFREGDNPRWIHWRRSLRTGRLVVREMLPYVSAHCLVIVDHSLADDSPLAAERRELAVSAAASLVCQALEGGIHIALLGLGDPILTVPPLVGREQLDRVLRELADLRGEPRPPLTQWVPLLLQRTSLPGRCVVCAAVESPQIVSLVRELRAIGMDPLLLAAESPQFSRLLDVSRVSAPPRQVFAAAGGVSR